MWVLCTAVVRGVDISRLTAVCIRPRVRGYTFPLMTYLLPSQKATLATKTEIYPRMQHK